MQYLKYGIFILELNLSKYVSRYGYSMFILYLYYIYHIFIVYL